MSSFESNFAPTPEGSLAGENFSPESCSHGEKENGPARNMEPLIVVVLGPPGSGKGTHSKLLSGDKGTPHISVGDLLRDEVQRDTPLGRAAKQFMDRGELVPEHLVNDLLEARLGSSDCKGGFVLDGYPRTVAQAEALDRILQKKGISISRVIDLKVPDEELVRRIVERGKGAGGRADDTEEVARERIRIYWERTAPVSDYYRKQGRLSEVEGTGGIPEVYGKIAELLKDK